MTKEEWYSSYRVYRSAVSSINREHSRGLSKSEHDDVWTLFWNGIYKKMPCPVFVAINKSDGRSLLCSHWGISSGSKMKCNMDHLRNSYPRIDVKNHGCIR